MKLILKNRSTLILALLSILCCINNTKAQLSSGNVASLDVINDRLIKLRNNFDSAYFLGFNIRYSYLSKDSSNNVVNTAQRDGNYIIRKNNIYYNLGDVEYMQNDSLSFLIYKNSKKLFVSPVKSQSTLSTTPIQSWIDTVTKVYNKYYDFYIRDNNTNETDTSYLDSSLVRNDPNANYVGLDSGTSTITFIAKQNIESSIILSYNKIALTYSTTTNLLTKVEVDYPQIEDFVFQDSIVLQDTTNIHSSLGDTLLSNRSGITVAKFTNHKSVQYNKQMNIYFYNYQYNQAIPSIFKSESYIYSNGNNNRIKLNNQYKGYMLYFSGVLQNTGY